MLNKRNTVEPYIFPTVHTFTVHTHPTDLLERFHSPPTYPSSSAMVGTALSTSSIASHPLPHRWPPVLLCHGQHCPSPSFFLHRRHRLPLSAHPKIWRWWQGRDHSVHGEAWCRPRRCLNWDDVRWEWAVRRGAGHGDTSTGMMCGESERRGVVRRHTTWRHGVGAWRHGSVGHDAQRVPCVKTRNLLVLLETFWLKLFAETYWNMSFKIWNSLKLWL